VSDVIREFRRDQAVEAARALFNERGTLEISMSEIADRAGVSRSLLYNHFSTRDDVLLACLEAGHSQLVDAIAEGLGRASDPMSKLVALLEACVNHVDRSPAFYRLMLSRTAPSPSDSASIEVGWTGVQVGGWIFSIVEEGVASGEFIDDVEAVSRLIGTVLAGLLQTRQATPEVPAHELASGVVRLLAEGVLAPSTRGPARR
jgi:AcrR family transcriptional regulator